MDKTRYGNWVAPFGLLLSLLTVITAQPGFLSISCGGITNHTGENDITWVSDADYIDVGKTVDIGEYATEKVCGSYLQTLRFFPPPLKKSCYKLPVTPDVPYLVRLWFAIGNYTGFPTLPSFQFSIETPGTLHVVNVTMSGRDPFNHHRILVSSGKVLYICFIRTSEHDDPFVSAIELRMFQHGMYPQAKPGTVLWPDYYNLGGNSVVRYPQDKFDRIWRSDDLSINAQIVGSVRNVSSQHAISTNNTKDLPPSAIMQTAWVENSGDSLSLPVDLGGVPKILYFAELEKLNMSESRSFYIQINGTKRSDTITLVRNYSAIELTLPLSADSQIYSSCNIVKATYSTRPPILNAFESHWLYNTDEATYAQDLYALEAIKGSFDIKEWVSDPCYQIPWNGIVCDSRSSPIRISELYLSGRNLTGSVPTDIGHLTALVYISLDNNHLMGNLPNFSNLTMVERLHLQNNNLTGSVEWLSKLKNLEELYLQNNNLSGNVQWLSELKNLKKLNIENNNFSGVIPAQLLLNCSLKLNYSGNHYLRILEKRKCTSQNSNNHSLKVVLGITLSGTLIIALGLILGVVYRNKFRRKGDGAATESNRVEKERKPFAKQDCSRIMVPNPSNCRAFTLNEITVATETFSREIGRGGFGSVFFGKLPEGKDIAVKVLSLFSHQGVQEFLNEVDLLSRINHRNLVSLLGYCNESREVMLIYEHMSGGSLRDHLYGPRAENSELNWKIRLNIALDAAQGLEYLHVGATSKIIHRDVKTANILLDGNLNGKLADFGLSRMTIDGQATHVTTTVKGTFGYLDPEYYNTQMLTEKSDIYSFGVVLLEIICGRPPIDPKLAEDGVNIIRWATPYILDMNENAGKVTEIIDKRLDGSYDVESITSVAKVALRCVQAERSSRPSVSEVVAELREAMKYEDKASISIPGEIGIETGDSSVDRVDSSERKGMKWTPWSDNSSSNISKEWSGLS